MEGSGYETIKRNDIKKSNVTSYPFLLQKNDFVTAYKYLSDSFKIEIDNKKIIDLKLENSPYLFLNLTSFIPKLCVKGLMPHHYGGLESPNVIIIDGGINEIDFYRIVEQSQELGVNIDLVLDGIILSRSFTINQLAHTIIFELPKWIQKYKSKLVVITNIYSSNNLKKTDCYKKENEWLILQMIDVINKMSRNCIVIVFSPVFIKYFNQVIRYR